MPNYSKVVQCTPATDGSTNFKSDAIDVSKLDKFSLQAKHDGSLVGTLELEGCVDEADGWDTLPDTSKSVSTAGSKIWDFPFGSGLTKVRFSWTRTSGTGNISGKINQFDGA